MSLTFLVFDEHIHLLLCGHFERLVLGVLGLVQGQAAVRLRDERLADVAHAAVSRLGIHVLWGQDQDAEKTN